MMVMVMMVMVMMMMMIMMVVMMMVMMMMMMVVMMMMMVMMMMVMMVIFLQEIAKHFDPQESGYEVVEDAIYTMTGYSGHPVPLRSWSWFQEVQSLLLNWAGLDLASYGELVLEGSFKVHRAKNQRTLFLLERLLLITKRRGEHYVCQSSISLLYLLLYLLINLLFQLLYMLYLLYLLLKLLYLLLYLLLYMLLNLLYTLLNLLLNLLYLFLPCCSHCSTLMLIESAKDSLSFSVTHYKRPKQPHTVQAKSVEEKKLWAHHIKRIILENHQALIPQKAKEAILEMDSIFYMVLVCMMLVCMVLVCMVLVCMVLVYMVLVYMVLVYMYPPRYRLKKSSSCQSDEFPPDGRQGRRQSEPVKEILKSSKVILKVRNMN
ncbi:Pleckstrin y domain-containing family G member 3 [Liparis tanakae]|uniref:Pleckstrin y domain-containing family G member 3 n=1 Tax=Liparis tanakae TaxID=230148 RepID=A0A4Z2FAZ7_9TELE|nr:Pleckstrin y domain-containing family G member 3 [Liparis tanakae]